MVSKFSTRSFRNLQLINANFTGKTKIAYKKGFEKREMLNYELLSALSFLEAAQSRLTTEWWVVCGWESGTLTHPLGCSVRSPLGKHLEPNGHFLTSSAKCHWKGIPGWWGNCSRPREAAGGDSFFLNFPGPFATPLVPAVFSLSSCCLKP